MLNMLISEILTKMITYAYELLAKNIYKHIIHS